MTRKLFSPPMLQEQSLRRYTPQDVWSKLLVFWHDILEGIWWKITSIIILCSCELLYNWVFQWLYTWQMHWCSPIWSILLLISNNIANMAKSKECETQEMQCTTLNDEKDTTIIRVTKHSKVSWTVYIYTGFRYAFNVALKKWRKPSVKLVMACLC